MRLIELDEILKKCHEIDDLYIYNSSYLAWSRDVLNNLVSAIDRERVQRANKQEKEKVNLRK